MEKYISILNKYIKPDSKIISTAIIEDENKIVYSSDNWDISSDIENINTTWRNLDERYITISGIKYIILQISTERLVASTLDKKGSVIGFKEEERKIICKIEPEGQIHLGLMEASRTLGKLRSKKPYLEPDTPLGKVEEIKWATPKVLLDETQNLQRLGLLKAGLSLEEARVYLALLKKGEKGDKIGNINKELEIKRTTIYRIIDRLVKNYWVEKVSRTPSGIQIYVARPLNALIDEIIQDKEEELNILKSFRYIMGEDLENGWIDIVEAKKDFQAYGEKSYDFNTLGIRGVDKDCGLIILEYDRSIQNKIVIRAALQLSYEKIWNSLQPDKGNKEYIIQDLEDIKVEDIEIQDYLGAIMYLKFKAGSDAAKNVGSGWITLAKHVAIPIDDKIYVIWGTEEKFPILLSMILKLK